MNWRTCMFAVFCVLALCGTTLANHECSQYMLAGDYLTTVDGFATVTSTPSLVVVPIVGIGKTNVDETGNVKAVTNLKLSKAGAAETSDMLGTLIVDTDCSVTLKTAQWEGTGHFIKATSEIYLILTKANGNPVAAHVTMKQIAKPAPVVYEESTPQ